MAEVFRRDELLKISRDLQIQYGHRVVAEVVVDCSII